MARGQRPVDTNPFSTRFIRPGALKFEFSEGDSIEKLIGRLAAVGWRGQIVGPHGSGKSTLCHALMRALQQPQWVDEKTRGESAHSNVVWIPLTRTERRPTGLTTERLTPETLVVIDGYEQLGWWWRRVIKRRVACSGAGLLVTAHSDVGLPTIYRTRPDLAIAQRLVARLLSPDGYQQPNAQRQRAIWQQRLEQIWGDHGGDVREVLMSLYDDYQLRRLPMDPGITQG